VKRSTRDSGNAVGVSLECRPERHGVAPVLGLLSFRVDVAEVGRLDGAAQVRERLARVRALGRLGIGFGLASGVTEEHPRTILVDVVILELILEDLKIFRVRLPPLRA